jgi:hypothetical protein
MFTPIYVPTSGKYLQIGPAPASTPILSIGDARSNVGVFTNAILSQPARTHKRYVLAYIEESTLAKLLEDWGKKLGREVAYVEVKSVDEYDNVWPKWGREMGVMMQFWGEERDNSWTGQEVLTTKDLGLEGEKFAGIEEAYGGIDWKALGL